MSPKIRKLRTLAFTKQDGRCYYCNGKMWIANPHIFANVHQVKRGAIERFRCTAEHLTARQDGGKDTATNIVAACWFCNTRRHRVKKPLTPSMHRLRVTQRIHQHRWHPPELHHILKT